jgi:hypothetical protein
MTSSCCMRLSRIWRISRVPARFYDFRGIPVRGEKLLSIGTFDCEIISTSVIAKLENKNKITPPRLSLSLSLPLLLFLIIRNHGLCLSVTKWSQSANLSLPFLLNNGTSNDWTLSVSFDVDSLKWAKTMAISIG